MTPALGFLFQEINLCIGASPVEGQQDDEGPGAYYLQEKAESARFLQL